MNALPNGAVSTASLGPRVPLMSQSPDQWIAVGGTFLRVLVGSGVHGTAIDGQDDEDQMGICIEPADTVTGLGRFEHYVYRTAEPHGPKPDRGYQSPPSGPGDLDLIIYSLRKWMRLAVAGNPTVLLPLYVGADHVYHCTPLGEELRANAHRIVSRRALAPFRGYLQSQRDAMMGRRAGSNGAGRRHIIDRYGYDTKFAMHAERLAEQGLELMRTGRLTLPVPEPALSRLRAVRRGEVSRDDVLARLDQLDTQLGRYRDPGERSPLADEPDYRWINAFLARAHLTHWGYTGDGVAW